MGDATNLFSPESLTLAAALVGLVTAFVALYPKLSAIGRTARVFVKARSGEPMVGFCLSVKGRQFTTDALGLASIPTNYHGCRASLRDPLAGYREVKAVELDLASDDMVITV